MKLWSIENIQNLPNISVATKLHLLQHQVKEIILPSVGEVGDSRKLHNTQAFLQQYREDCTELLAAQKLGTFQILTLLSFMSLYIKYPGIYEHLSFSYIFNYRNYKISPKYIKKIKRVNFFYK
jgi:hypothetical protein